MTLSASITALTGALDVARADLAITNGKIEELQAERRLIVNRAPHTDDIVAAFMNGLQAGSASFTRQLGTRLADTYSGDDGGAAVQAAPGKTFDILRFDAQKLDREALVTRAMTNEQPSLNVAAVIYFLRDRIEAEIPTLVDKLCPAARDGIKATDRKLALEKIDVEIAALREEAERLQADINAVRAAVSRA